MKHATLSSAEFTEGKESISEDIYISGKSPQGKNRFGHLLDEYADKAGKDTSSFVSESLSRLATKMYQDGRQVEDNEDMPAGYLFFAQLMAHDLSYGRKSIGDTVGVPSSQLLRGLTLDCIYAGGPGKSPMLYQLEKDKFGYRKHSSKLRIGLTDGLVNYNSSGMDQYPEGRLPRDLPRIDLHSEGCNYQDVAHYASSDNHVDDHRAGKCPIESMIADQRNDDNLIISQMVVLFHRYHNAIIDKIREDSELSIAEEFQIASTLVISTYQSIIENDFLPRILDPDVYDKYKDKCNYSGGKASAKSFCFETIPLEFSIAAFRFGHALIQPLYKINATKPIQHGGIDSLLSFDADRGGRHLPIYNDWIVDWSLFFPVMKSKKTNYCRKITPTIASKLYKLKMLTTHYKKARGGMAYLDLWRAYESGLPNGQAMAEYFSVPCLSYEELYGDKDNGLSSHTESYKENPLMDDEFAGGLATVFSKDTPLYYYMLRESEVKQNGEKLGQVGSNIIAKVVCDILATSKANCTRVEPWVEKLFSKKGLPMTMVDMIDVLAILEGNVKPTSRPFSQTTL